MKILKEVIIRYQTEDGVTVKAYEQGELIRCKDCKHRPKVIEGCVEIDGFSLEFPDFECPCRCEDSYYSWMPKDDWYCGNGERKEE